jgi:hypothetical protein
MSEFSTDSAFPIWTETVNTTAGSGAAGPSGRGRGDASLSSISEILGWRVNKSDAQGIRRALDEAFSINRTEDGQTVVEWKQRGFRVQAGSSGIAEVTGAQRSLYERAKAIVEQIYPLLDGLLPLRSAPDREDVSAIQSLIRPELEELVEQFGVEGGPVPQRIDNALQLLIAYDPEEDGPMVFIDPLDVEGQLGMLRRRLGLRPDRVNTIEEELRLTNFVTLVNYVDMLRVTWHAQRASFDREGTDGAFLGTQTILIERTLGCVAESVQEVYRALDSVFIGPLERSSITISLVTVAELLDWIDDVATTRAFEIIRDGGKDGIEHALVPTLTNVIALTGDVLEVVDEEEDDKDEENVVPRGMRTARVRGALHELHVHLQNALAQSEAVQRPPRPRGRNDESPEGASAPAPPEARRPISRRRTTPSSRTSR